MFNKYLSFSSKLSVRPNGPIGNIFPSEIKKKSFGFNNIDPNIINFNNVSFMQSRPSRFFPKKVY